MATRCLEACFNIQHSRCCLDWLVCSCRGSLGYNVKLECLIENRQLIGLIGGSFGKSSIIYLGEYNLTGTYLRTLRDRDLD